MTVSDGMAARFVDLGDGPSGVTCNPPSGSIFPVNETTIVNCTSADIRGNTSSASFTVYKAENPLNSSIATLVTATITVPHDMRDKNN